jgi:hypothetical protein
MDLHHGQYEDELTTLNTVTHLLEVSVNIQCWKNHGRM